MASGVVFEDGGRNGAGARPGDPGIAGVLVSNGREVVTTDADGRWRLPVVDGDSIFVIKPPNWSTPLGPRRRAAVLPSAPAVAAVRATSPTAMPAWRPPARCPHRSISR